ncbi:MAG: hypothetical protein HRU08_03335 [Oleispira sp.]|nr:hypothetical protein [Oleispira sp.]
MTIQYLLTRWLRSKQLPLLLSFMLLATAAIQSLHDQLDHGGSIVSGQCEFCLVNQSLEEAIIPLAISLPIRLFDQAPEIFLPLMLPFSRQYRLRTRAPPLAFSH